VKASRLVFEFQSKPAAAQRRIRRAVADTIRRRR
jgi:hypothetical protein